MSKKITTELNAFRKLVRMRDFIVANHERFGAETPAAKAVSGVISTVTNLRKLTTEQAALENRLRELSRVKLEARAALRKEVEFIHHTARSIAAETPGFEQKFQMPQQGDLKLLHAARAAVQDAAPDAAAFIKHAMPPDFLEILEAKVEKFEQAAAA